MFWDAVDVALASEMFFRVEIKRDASGAKNDPGMQNSWNGHCF